MASPNKLAQTQRKNSIVVSSFKKTSSISADFTDKNMEVIRNSRGGVSFAMNNPLGFDSIDEI